MLQKNLEPGFFLLVKMLGKLEYCAPTLRIGSEPHSQTFNCQSPKILETNIIAFCCNVSVKACVDWQSLHAKTSPIPLTFLPPYLL